MDLLYQQKSLAVAGWLQLKLVEKAHKGEVAVRQEAARDGETRNGVGAAIQRLEEQLTK